jgi:hypothetical protein
MATIDAWVAPAAKSGLVRQKVELGPLGDEEVEVEVEVEHCLTANSSHKGSNRALQLPPGGVECSHMRLRLRSRSESRRRCRAVVRG